MRFLDQTVGKLEREQAELRKAADRLVTDTDALLNHHVEKAWQAIEDRASRLVEKSGQPLTQERAIELVLQREPSLYGDYQAAVAARAATAASVDNAVAVRQHRAWLEQEIADRVLKAAGAGLDADEALELELQKPGVAEALGVDRPVKVEKGAESWARIERAASQLMQKEPGLGPARAVARVLERDPAMYAEYVAELNTSDEDVEEESADVAPFPVDVGLRDRSRADWAAMTAAALRKAEFTPDQQAFIDAISEPAEVARLLKALQGIDEPSWADEARENRERLLKNDEEEDR